MKLSVQAAIAYLSLSFISKVLSVITNQVSFLETFRTFF